jgi:hypothetical protein
MTRLRAEDGTSLLIADEDARCLYALRQGHAARHAVRGAVATHRRSVTEALALAAGELAILAPAAPGSVTGAGRVRQFGRAISEALIWGDNLHQNGLTDGAKALGQAVVFALRELVLPRDLTRHFDRAATAILEG